MPDYLEKPHTNNVRSGVPRDMDTDYVINATYHSVTTVTIRFSGAQTDTSVTFMMGSAEPDIAIASVRAGSSVLLGLVSISRTDEYSMSVDVPAGYHVKLVTSGSGTSSIVNVQETIYANASQP